MKKIEFGIHVILLFLLVMLLITCWNDFNGFIMWLAYLQFVVGVCQLLSALRHTLLRTLKYPLNTRLNQYWFGVIGYGLLLWLLIALEAPGPLFRFVFFGGGWGLAVVYFSILYRHYQGRIPTRTKRSGFLPNLEF